MVQSTDQRLAESLSTVRFDWFLRPGCRLVGAGQSTGYGLLTRREQQQVHLERREKGMLRVSHLSVFRLSLISILL
jgi:hypothetical protein